MKNNLIISAFFIVFATTISSSANAAIVLLNTPEPYCREFTQAFTIGNKIQQGYGTACLQPDGSWLIQKPASLEAAQPVLVTQQVTYVEQPTYIVPVRPYRQRIIVGYPYHYRHYVW